MTPRLPAIRYGPAWSAIPSQRLTFVDAPVWGGGFAAAIGVVVLIGWVLGVETLKSMLPGLVAMKANTAVCFVLIGVGVILLARAAPASASRSVGLVLVGAATLIALATGAQFLTGLDFGIDQLLFREPAGQVGTVVPGRMSPLTTICFTLLGLAAFAFPRSRRVVIALSATVLGFAALFVFDFVFGATTPPLLTGYTPMALNTAVAVGVLALGILGLLGPNNPFALLAGRSSTTSLLRRLLAVSVAVPVVMAWLRLEGQRLGLFDTTFGTALMLVGILALGVIAILRSARWADELETRRVASEIERDRFFELSLDMLAVIGADGLFSRVNGAWQSVLGYPPSELIAKPLLDLVHPDDLDRTIAEYRRHFEEGEPVESFQNRYRHRDGSYRWLEWMSQTAPDRSVAFAVARDVTDRKRGDDRRAKQNRVLESRNEALSERVIRDSLTGLHNRRYFDIAIARLQQRWSRLPIGQQPPVSVVIFDLDHFGQVNKLYGHQAGDAVLRLFSVLLKKRFRESDLVARYGGEEFVAVLEGATSLEASRIAEDVRAAFERMSIDIGTDSPIHVTVSAGCAQLGDDGNVAASLSLADVWLSQAKRAGRNQVIGL